MENQPKRRVPITVEQARVMFENVANSAPDRWTAAVQTLIIDVIETQASIVSKMVLLAQGSRALSVEFAQIAPLKDAMKVIMSMVPQTQASQETPQEESGAPALGGAEVSPIGADELPRTSEQIENERLMNIAIEEEAAAKRAAAGQAAVAPRPPTPRAGGSKRPTLAPVPAPRPQVPVGPPKQEDIEEQMNQALGGEDKK